MGIEAFEPSTYPAGHAVPSLAFQREVLQTIYELQYGGTTPSRPTFSCGPSKAYRAFACPDGVPKYIVHACFHRVRPTISWEQWNMDSICAHTVDAALSMLIELGMLREVSLETPLPIGSFQRAHDGKEVVCSIGKHPNFTPISQAAGKELACYLIECDGEPLPVGIPMKGNSPASPEVGYALTADALASFLTAELPKEEPLTDAQTVVMNVIERQGPITGPTICKELNGAVTLRNLTRHVLPKLKARGLIANKRKAGYYTLPVTP